MRARTRSRSMRPYGGRIHLVIADRSQRLDAEEEGVREAVRPSVRHRTGYQPKECGEDDIHRQIKREQGGKELRPCQGNSEMIGIAQIEAGNPFLFEFVGAEAEPRHLRARARPECCRRLLVVSSRPALPVRRIHRTKTYCNAVPSVDRCNAEHQVDSSLSEKCWRDGSPGTR